MGYGNVAPAPVRSTDCAAAVPAKNATADRAVAMLRTVLITYGSVKGSLSHSKLSRSCNGWLHGMERLCHDQAVVATSGKKILIVAPDPTTLSALTDPPWASTRCFTIARPSPVPPASRERPLSAR